MFTGIVQERLAIKSLLTQSDYTRVTIDFPDYLLEGLAVGASVALDGICCTVVSMQENEVAFDVINATRQVTNFKDRVANDLVNIERAAKSGSENSGHVIAGHVTGTAQIIEISTTSVDNYIRFKLAKGYSKYVFSKGFIALNGASLTVADTDFDSGIATVNLIPETLRQTNFSNYQVGHEINFEIEYQTQVMVDTIERCLSRVDAH